jgi:sulfite exporter TauE/SafE
MTDSVVVSLFLIGLLGGVHCVGMCGGIVSALSFQSGQPMQGQALRHLAYNAGRILTYAIAGGIVGGIGQAGVFLAGRKLAPFHYLLANLMLIALGLYMMGITRFLAPFERAGGVLWQKIQPISRRLLPARTTGQAFTVGVVWGWLPCGLVYSALATALSTGSIQGGMYGMLAFGLGTLPNLMLAGLMAVRLRAFTRQAWIRYGGGTAILLFGLYGGWIAMRKILG